MYAIVEIKGQQFKAEEGKYLYVHHLGDEVKEGESMPEWVITLEVEHSTHLNWHTVDRSIDASLIAGIKSLLSICSEIIDSF